VNGENKNNYLKRLSFDSLKRFRRGFKPFVESHRGCNKDACENTIAAFKLAIELGCDSIEFDVWLTSDKIPVVIHGGEHGEIDETTNGTGKLNDLTLREVSQLRTKKNEPIPTLEEVLLFCKDKIFFNIEIKDCNYAECFEQILNLIHKYDLKAQCAISSFKHQYWDEMKKVQETEKIEFGFLYECKEERGEVTLNFDIERENSTINVHYKDVSEEFVKKVHMNNIAVHCWFNMEDEETAEIMRYLFGCGVDVICCNHPNIALKIREEMYGI
jgi:glycerophosphoryl diester phosphodiesterase